uniref:Uncharacterized protein n=1 Tax=Setaria viridis TaxID=4556 RepID=A0A4U6VXE0_SETVI|nr:hypothetical protein SEVIR_3G410100v2 [Setaria viridis]
MGRRALVVAMLLLMQCCNVILAARPFQDAVAGDGAGRGYQLGHGGEAPIMRAPPKLPGGGNCRSFQGPDHPPCEAVPTVGVGGGDY